MNYISHHEVARQYDPDASPDFLFGACAPDFGRMAGERLFLKELPNPELQAGMELHSQTNLAFDGQPAMENLEVSLRAGFAAFLPERTARQASRVSKDLLFDGLAFRQTEVVGALRATVRQFLRSHLAADPPLPPSLQRVLRGVRDHGPPQYDQIRVVSNRLAVTLSKTRTPILQDFLPMVDVVLKAHQQAIFTVGPAVMAETVDLLKTKRPV